MLICEVNDVVLAKLTLARLDETLSKEAIQPDLASAIRQAGQARG